MDRLSGRGSGARLGGEEVAIGVGSGIETCDGWVGLGGEGVGRLGGFGGGRGVLTPMLVVAGFVGGSEVVSVGDVTSEFGVGGRCTISSRMDLVLVVCMQGYIS